MIVDIDGMKVACGLDWFKTAYGIAALIISIVLAFIGAFILKQINPEEEWTDKNSSRR